jgi:signal transduction histidine kinase
MDAIANNGDITVETRSDAGSPDLVVTISDSGPGISPDALGKIFDPFFTTKEAGRGTGLGLSISRAIIEKLGGKITVCAGGERGAAFSIRLPKKKAGSAA